MKPASSPLSFEPHTMDATNWNDLILALATLCNGHFLLLCCVIDHPALHCLTIVLSASPKYVYTHRDPSQE